MEKADYKFDDFLKEVNNDHKEFVNNIHKEYTKDGYKTKIELKSSGFFVSYSHPKTKHSKLNFFFRKNGFFVRVYPEDINKHKIFLDKLPENMIKEIGKSSVCKRMINPNECNQKCVMGYDFKINKIHYQKCRFSCFSFIVNMESIPFIKEFVKNENK